MTKKAQEHTLTLVEIRSVVQQVKKCKTLVYAGVKEKTFPPPIKVGKRRVAWLQADIDTWIRQQVERSRSEVA